MKIFDADPEKAGKNDKRFFGLNRHERRRRLRAAKRSRTSREYIGRIMDPVTYNKTRFRGRDGKKRMRKAIEAQERFLRGENNDTGDSKSDRVEGSE